MRHSIFRMIRDLYHIDRKYMFVSLLSVPISTINPLIDIYFLRHFLECISEEKSIKGAVLILGMMFALNIINLLWDGYIGGIFMPIHEKNISFAFRNLFIDKVKDYDAQTFDDPNFYDRYLIASGSADSRCIGIWRSCVNTLSLLTSIGTIIGLIITTDIYLIIFALISAAIGLIPQLMRAKTDYEYTNKKATLDRQQDYFGRLMYNKSFIYDTKMTNIEAVLKKQLKKCTADGITLLKQFSKKNLFSDGFQTLIASLFTLATWLYLGLRIIFGYYTIAAFTSMFNACNSFRNNIRSFVSVIAEFRSHKLYADKIYDFLDGGTLTQGETDAGHLPRELIELKGIYFSYSGQTIPALRNINFVIHRGEKIAIVGRNGAGKSTLIKMLLGLYRPTSGKILMDGICYSNISQNSLKQVFSCCFQDMILYSVSLGENISMDAKYSPDRVFDCLNAVGMGSYTTSLQAPVNRDFHSDGLNFSGGETQRIGIARTLYSNGDILIFDEANSALDPIAEKKLNELIYQVSGEHTTIFISHRLTTAIKADRIIYMEDGQIIESGTHRQLLELNGRYAELYHAQIDQLNTTTETYNE